MKLIDTNKNHFWLFLIIIAVLISALPVFIFGVSSGNDVVQHFQFAQVFHDAIISGNIFPSWSAFENHGFGGIGTRFYPPLAYYVLAIFRIIFGNWYDATWVTFTLWFLIGSIGTYLWAKEFFPIKEAGIAGILFALSPFNLVQLYQFFIYAEFAACSIIPFCFLFVTRIIRRQKLIDVIGLGISYALLILTHIPLTLIGSISLLIYTLLFLDWKKFKKPLIQLICGAIIGSFASSFHWIKIVMEMQWLNHASPTFSSDLYHYNKYFFPLPINFAGNFWASYYWLLDISTLFVVFSILIPVIFLAVKTKLDFLPLKTFRAGLITGLFALFMSTALSSVIWQIFPVLQKIQFPWRWISIVFIVGSISFAGFIVPIIKHYKSNRLVIYLVLLSVAALLFFNYTQIIISSAPIGRDLFEQKLSNLINEESFDCWWTIWAKREAFENKEKVSTESRQVLIKNWDRETREFEIEAGNAQNVRIATFYYPHWQAEINGNKIKPNLAEDGTILINVPSEKANVKIYFQSPSYIKITAIISILTWLFLFCGLGFTLRKRK